MTGGTTYRFERDRAGRVWRALVTTPCGYTHELGHKDAADMEHLLSRIAMTAEDLDDEEDELAEYRE